jgi:hypothetical protein
LQKVKPGAQLFSSFTTLLPGQDLAAKVRFAKGAKFSLIPFAFFALFAVNNAF